MEIDAMQYASISNELLRGENILHLFDNGAPYLDKPPLIFWITALFFKLFGSSDFVYRVPSILFTLLLVYSTYRFSRLYYSENVSQIAALILSSSQALFIMNADVRTDIYMMAPMMLAIWQLTAYFFYHKWKNLLIGWIAISLAMMGKGPLGIVIPLSVLIMDLLLNRKIQVLLDKRLLVGLLICLFCLLPMSYGLHTQFGSHGLEFFYWTQSFGRITGDSSWTNSTGPFYLFNVFLYAFLPWTLISLMAIIEHSRDIFKKKYDNGKVEYISFFGFILPMLMLSASNYKLPHYVYCVIPFASILTAVKVEDWLNKKYYKILNLIQIFLVTSMLLLIFGLTYYAFGIQINMIIVPILIFLVFTKIAIKNKENMAIRFLIPSLVASILCSYGFNIGFMRPLLQFQSESRAAFFIKEHGYEDFELYFYEEDSKAKSRSCNFYLDRNIKYIDRVFLENKSNPKPELIFTNDKGLKELLDYKIGFEILSEFEHIRVSKLKVQFIDPVTRPQVTRKKYLLKCI